MPPVPPCGSKRDRPMAPRSESTSSSPTTARACLPVPVARSSPAGGRLAALANAPGARFLLDLPAAAGPDLELPAHRSPGADLVGTDAGQANVVEGRR